MLNPEQTTTELFDLSKDIGEEKNVAAGNPEIIEELIKLMNSARTESEVFSFRSPTIIK